MTEKLEQQDIAAVRNPADYINTYYVTLLDTQTGESINTTTHNYSIEECALDVKEKLIERFVVTKIVQPDTNAQLTKEEISEL